MAIVPISLMGTSRTGKVKNNLPLAPNPGSPLWSDSARSKRARELPLDVSLLHWKDEDSLPAHRADHRPGRMSLEGHEGITNSSAFAEDIVRAQHWVGCLAADP